MKKKHNKIKIIFLAVLILFSTGCTKVLKDTKTKKAVINPTTGQSLTENILCQPTDKETIELYEKYKVDISKLPTCKRFSVTSGGYEGLWNSIFVKPLAWFIIQIGNFVKSYGLSLVLTSLLIRFIAVPITKNDNKERRFNSQVVYPIISDGDVIGSVILLSKETGTKMTEVEQKVVQSAASFLGRQMEI